METKAKIKGGGGALERGPPTKRDSSVNREKTKRVQSDPIYLRYSK